MGYDIEIFMAKQTLPRVLPLFVNTYYLLHRAVHRSLSFDLNQCLALIAFDQDLTLISDTLEGTPYKGLWPPTVVDF